MCLMCLPELVVASSSSLVVLRDKFPKARHHYLVLPRWVLLHPLPLLLHHLPPPMLRS